LATRTKYDDHSDNDDEMRVLTTHQNDDNDNDDDQNGYSKQQKIMLMTVAKARHEKYVKIVYTPYEAMMIVIVLIDIDNCEECAD